jgi:hypothetical protein
MFIRFVKFSVVPVTAYFDLFINIVNTPYLTKYLSLCKFQ